MSTWTESQIITLVAGSSVLAAVLTQTITGIRDFWSSNQDRTFAKLYASAALENYANQLSMAVSESKNYDASGGEAGKAVINIPEFPAFSPDIDWRSLGAATTKRLLAFPVDVDRLRAELSFEWDVVGDPELTVPKVREYAAWVGLRALQLAAELNAEFAGEPIELLGANWDLKDSLQKEYDDHRGSRTQQEQADQELVLEITQGCKAIQPAPG